MPKNIFTAKQHIRKAQELIEGMRRSALLFGLQRLDGELLAAKNRLWDALGALDEKADRQPRPKKRPADARRKR